MKRFFWIVLALCMASTLANARDFDTRDFARIPVQHEGRIKPIDTFARTFLKSFSGHESLPGMDANAWLAETLFDPAQALHRPVFRIVRPSAFGFSDTEKKYFSYAEIAPMLQKKAKILENLSRVDDKNLTPDQRELIRLEESSALYAQLLRSFSYVLPLNIAPPDALVREWRMDRTKPFTFNEYKRFQHRLQQKVKNIIRKRGEDPLKYNDSERDIATFAFEMRVLEQAGENNVLFRILPGESGAEWFSPWAITQSGQGSPRAAFYLGLWQNLAMAYLQDDGEAWSVTTEKIVNASSAFTSQGILGWEIIYNNWHLIPLSMLFYLTTFAGFVLYSLRGTQVSRRISFSFLLAGGTFHFFAIALRVLILARPPVGTLYESVLFVAFICVLISLILEFLKRDGNGLFIGSLTGLLLTFAAQSLAEGDTMQMLTAVLNTNFWLATHVLCITMGYGWCLIVSFLAHLWMMRRAWNKETDSLVRPIKILSLIALLFTALGTILGGIWADQSWGRFWGWDPKENGALFIVLWLIWILHAQISGHIRQDAAMALSALLSIIVGLSWFGVNLLNVGLHSYGFITGVAAGLGAFCIVEGLVIGSLFYGIRKKRLAA